MWTQNDWKEYSSLFFDANIEAMELKVQIKPKTFTGLLLPAQNNLAEERYF